MDDLSLTDLDVSGRARVGGGSGRSTRHTRRWRALGLAVVVAALAAVAGMRAWLAAEHPAAAPPPPPQVTVSLPLQRTVQASRRFLGQFSAVDSVELRAQVGGILTAVSFRDGQIVRKGDLLFTIDPRPFQIRLDQGVAQLQTAQAKESLAEAELWRAQQLKRTEFGTAETVDQRAADQHSQQAAIDRAKAAIMDARLDLEFSRITAPFAGRIGAHLVSAGNLVSGSRGGTSPTTLLATIVSLDPVYLDFDMSESDYLAWQQANGGAMPHADVAINLDGDGHYDHHGTLDFIDNVVNRSSGTIHARATVPNPDFTITPGQFARLRIALGQAATVLLVPAAAVVPDQSQHLVMTVAADGTVVPKVVEIGDLHDGLRVIRGGLAITDRVVIDGVVRARPGAKVTPINGVIKPDPSGDED
jgi:membrane fusion protein, multidrug efflux system